MANPQPTLQ
jgi:microcompartment protein CcmK/EutM